MEINRAKVPEITALKLPQILPSQARAPCRLAVRNLKKENFRLKSLFHAPKRQCKAARSKKFYAEPFHPAFCWPVEVSVSFFPSIADLCDFEARRWMYSTGLFKSWPSIFFHLRSFEVGRRLLGRCQRGHTKHGGGPCPLDLVQAFHLLNAKEPSNVQLYFSANVVSRVARPA